MKINTSKSLIALALPLVIATAMAMAQAPVRDTIEAATAPSKRIEMNFPGIGVVKTVPVKVGQRVKVDDVLIVQDTDIDDGELKRLKVEADSTARLRFAELDKEYKEKVLERKKAAGATAGGQHVFSGMEIQEAELDVARAGANIDVVKEENQVSGIRVDQQKDKIKKMTLKSPVSGVVETINTHEGELSSLDTDKPAIIVVQNDPIHVIIRSLYTSQVAKLELGETLEVRYVDETEWRPAKVIYKTPFADSSSDRQTVWLEMPNPQMRDAGLPVVVKLPAKALRSPGGPAMAAPR